MVTRELTTARSQPQNTGLAQRGTKLLRRALKSPLAEALAYPHGVEAYLDHFTPAWSAGWSARRTRAVVDKAILRTSDTVSLQLRTNGNFPRYEAGQYVELSVEIDGTRHTRCFSISSAPTDPAGHVEITVKARASGGLVSPFLVRHARRGMRVELSEPKGEFVLPRELPGRLLLVSGGSGITPCMSMLRALMATGYDGRVVFLHFARSPEDVIFRAELAQLAAMHPNLELVVQTESELGRMPSLDEPLLEAVAPGFSEWDCWVCGPSPLMNAVSRLYETRGAASRVRSEAFVLAPNHEGVDGEAGELVFLRSKTRVDGDARSLLEQAESAGLSPKHGCRMGICKTCRCRKVSGVTRDVRTGELSTENDVDIAICVSVPVGDVALDL